MLEKDIDLIDRFFERDLNEEELALFSTRLEKDPSFETQLAKYEFALQTASSIYSPEKEANQQQLREQWTAQKNKISTAKISRFSRKKFLSIAASLLFILATSWWFYQSNFPKNSDVLTALAVQTQKMENFDIAERGNPNAIETLLAYENGAYDKVLVLTKAIELNDMEGQLLRGRALVNLKRFEEGIPHFEKVLQQQYIKQDEALWNLALVYYKLGNIEQSKFYLQQIINDNFGTKQNAKKILELIEE